MLKAKLSVRSRLAVSLFRYMSTAAMLLLLVGTVANAQSDTNGSTPAGLAPGAPAGSYSLGGLDTVNLFNGHMNFRLPLLSVSGRGAAGYQMTLPVEQTWTVFKQTNEITHVVTYHPEPNWWTAYKPGYGPGVMQGRKGGSGSVFCGQNSPWFRYSNTLTRLTFTVGDGTEFELRDQLTSGQPRNPVNCTTGFNRGKIFVSADGSATTFISDADIVDTVVVSEDGATVTPSGFLLLRDGTRYRIDGGTITWIRDRNGNKLSFVYDTFKRMTSVTDSLNRNISVAYVVPFNTPGSEVITYTGFGGAPRTISVNYDFMQNALRSDQGLQTYRQLFPDQNGSTTTNYNPIVIKSVTLPNNQQYQLFYNSYGEVARAVLPTGGAMEYDYAAGIVSEASSGSFGGGPNGKHVYRRLVERRVYPGGLSGGNYESKMTYSRPELSLATNLGYVVTEQCTPSGTIGQCGSAPALQAKQQHYFFGATHSSFFQNGTAYGPWQDGREYQTDEYDVNGTTVLRRSENIWEQRAPVSWWTGLPVQEPGNDTRLKETITTLMDTNQVAKEAFGYDDSVPYNNQNNVKNYDFGSGTPGLVLRETRSTFVTDTAYTGTDVHLRNLPLQVSSYAANILQTQTVFEYDNYGTGDVFHAAIVTYPRAGVSGDLPISGFDSAFNSTTNNLLRGNITKVTRNFVTAGAVTGSTLTYSQYDVAGNVVKAIDPRSTTGNVIATAIDYADRFGGPNGDARANSGSSELNTLGQFSYALPTLVTNALGHTIYTQYDYYLGKPVDGEDANGTVASGFFSDSLDRPTQVKRAVGTAAESHSTFSYDDTSRIITTTSDFATNNDGALVSKLFYDQMGRTIERRQYEGVSNYIAVQTEYDVLGRDFKTSNPFRPWQSETAVWATSAFDALGRVTSVTSPDNATVSTAYSGNQVLVTDPSGKQRISKTNALGQLKDIWEITAADAATESVSFPGHAEVTAGYHTSYSYDPLDDLISVTQGTQPSRTFAYDSLKRLTSAFSPESGTTNYVYDAAGNLTQKSDARPVTTTIAYDALSRPTSKSYNDSPQTPTVNYFYDSQTLPSGAPTFDRGSATGRLVAVTYGGGSAGNYTGFDVLGRSVRRIQRTDSVNYLVEASYNVSSIVGETYPNVPGFSDRRAVGYTFDSAGRLSSATSGATSYSPGAGVSTMTYAAHGALSSETYGNSRVHAVTYNDRLQVNGLSLGTALNPTSILNLAYSYGTTTNNGSVQSISSLGAGLVYTQAFNYDALNRLTTASENWTSGTSWSQTNGYDRFGNRWIDLGGGNQSLYFNPSTNRITGGSYDGIGNLLSDGVHTYTYDAENKIRTVDGVTAYVYDGDGQRVKKLAGENTLFVYDIGGQMIMEFDAVASALTKEYLYVGGSMATIAKGVKAGAAVVYVTSDHLGSPRVSTKADGSVVARHDYKPFGEEIFAGTGGRTTTQGYSVTDGVRQKFTNKERDNETGLDYFLARYYSSTQGRFTSADPSGASMQLKNPQSWNRYPYALNNPLAYVDKNGKWPTWIHNLIIDRALPGLSGPQRQKIKDGSWFVDDPTLGGQMTVNSNEHGMTRPGQKPEDAATEAGNFINTHVDRAQAKLAAGDFDGSLHEFGMAFHTVSDMTSPAHEGYQVWNWYQASLHRDEEKAISSFRMGLAVGATIALYKYTYGQAAMKRAVNYTPGSGDDPSVIAIRGEYSLPGSDARGEAEALYEYRLGLQEGLNYDWSRQWGRRGRRQSERLTSK